MAATCGLQGPDLAAVVGLQGASASCLHELVACGQAQTRLAKSLVVAIFLHNKTAFDFTPETLGELSKYAEMLDINLEAGDIEHANGRWHVGTPSKLVAMDFWVEFAEPPEALPSAAGAGNPLASSPGQKIVANPFALESYLIGAKVSSSNTFAEMKKNMKLVNHYTFTWERVGPLGHLLADANGHVANPIELNVSLMDFAMVALGQSVPKKFGPFANVTDLMMASDGTIDRIYDTDTHMKLGLASPAASIVQLMSGKIGFSVQYLTGQDHDWTMDSTPGQLDFLKMGALKGAMAHTVWRPQREGGVQELGLTNNFGAGSAYPTATWQCAP